MSTYEVVRWAPRFPGEESEPVVVGVEAEGTEEECKRWIQGVFDYFNTEGGQPSKLSIRLKPVRNLGGADN